ncbi:uncharacterized protein SPPG_08685 [Spizellomyces punctatus DAOM BR117]|uniref:Uncharacterized protein n=1 Tax=Spizellomyces punctatus (strain DAOM BR117) TaxID=645134 RepID=A0A0L0H403_SPIPD|nr:uncharacterized protein SPPG_08685 [Spizellomyces punctatus DAOM BR117]KNC95932.1 hypothetical protein SPPG_08685 [Spizellomyces punctatus DAOM BR117]|eukprot:XP_016603972.1 hypothetical protein SPPG_08685 [Spizellomyces punctatus DAOM BR117]
MLVMGALNLTPAPPIALYTCLYVGLAILEITYPVITVIDKQWASQYLQVVQWTLPRLVHQVDHTGLVSQERYFTQWFLMYILHILPGVAWSVIAMMQLTQPLPTARIRSRSHRIRGRLQLICALIICATSFYMNCLDKAPVTYAPKHWDYSIKGWLQNSDAALAFNALWVMLTGWFAYTKALAIPSLGSERPHAIWAIRHVMAIYGVGLMRIIYIGTGLVLDVIRDPRESVEFKMAIFGMSMWIGIVLSILQGEWMLRRAGWVAWTGRIVPTQDERKRVQVKRIDKSVIEKEE